MASFSEKFIRGFRTLLPSPLSIAILLTLFTFLLALTLTKPEATNTGEYALNLMTFWEKGLWGFDLNNGTWQRSWQLPFLVQMMLMLVLGYIMALSQPFKTFISNIVQYCNTTAKAALIVTFITLCISLFNWGLGLIFGAIFAREVAEYASQHRLKLNYGLIGAAGYSGLMVWHGGLSGSAPLKAAEPGSLTKLVPNANLMVDHIPISETLFSQMNIIVTVVLLIVLPLSMYFIGLRVKSTPITLNHQQKAPEAPPHLIGIEKMDHHRLFSTIIGAIFILYAFYLMFIKPSTVSLKILSPDFINLVLLGLALLVHKSIHHFLQALQHAIGSAAGILIQFPFYFGILGLMKYSGLMGLMSDFFVEISNTFTFSINAFISAGIVNIFVPSGGGQWAVQGPIVLQAANQMGLSLPKSVMAIAYGDQLTNMLQPFWALPLLGITGLKAKAILPYTLVLMCIGAVIFILGLILF